MKLRIKGNSIRLRLTISEVERLHNTGIVEETTEFGNNAFGYAIRKSDKCSVINAEFNNSTIVLNIPESISDNWTNTEIVSISSEQPLPNNKILYILIEKDFKRNGKNISEDQSDNFENPNTSCG